MKEKEKNQSLLLEESEKVQIPELDESILSVYITYNELSHSYLNIVKL
jgi:hypothetical protein